MATRKQKQDLMAALRFTPREIEITLSGYGGEIVMGRITEAAYDYWQDRDDLGDYVYDWDNNMEVPADAAFCPDGAWHDVDDICHENGCEASDACRITVDDLLEGKTVWETNLDLTNLDSHGVDTTDHSHVVPNETEPDGTHVFMGQSFEKGVFFAGTVEITEPFDPAQLAISWTDCDGWRLISGVTYSGEEVDGYGAYSTTGKGTDFRVYRVERDEESEPVTDTQTSEDTDTDADLERWKGHALTPWWGKKDVPQHDGRYQVMLGTWPFPTFADYSAQQGWTQNGSPVAKLTAWRGLTEPAGKQRIKT
jgi:hypothetical protein